MRYHRLFAGALRRGPDRLGAQRRAVEAGEAVENRKLCARRARHAVTADAGNTRRRAGHERGKSRRRLRGVSGHDIFGDGTAGYELGEVGQFAFADEFLNERRHGAVPSHDDGF